MSSIVKLIVLIAVGLFVAGLGFYFRRHIWKLVKRFAAGSQLSEPATPETANKSK